MNLNIRASRLVESMLDSAEELKIDAAPIERGGRVIDCGVDVKGGLKAGVYLAKVCMADLAKILVVPGEVAGRACPSVQVYTDHPVAACLASQYAGWAINEGSYFAMGSGPMRAAYGNEALFQKIGHTETSHSVVGVLETRTKPTPEVFAKIAAACRVPTSCVTLLVAPTASIACGLQVVARSVETALHKLVELNFDLKRIHSAQGVAPLPPVARHDLAAIGRTNDAILYGGRVVLFVDGDDESIAEIGPRVPSTASKDHGEPFYQVFKRYNNDFYKVDPHLFSPAEVVFQNIATGRVHSFGHRDEGVLEKSFFA